MADRTPRPPKAPPQAIDLKSKSAGLRAVAILEATKGSLVLLAEFGILSLIHKDAGEVAEHVVRHLHLNPERRISHSIIEAASHLDDAKLWAIAAGGLMYVTVRFAEAYGLWHRRVWAEWFALLSGALYLPWEIYEFGARHTPVRAIILLSNLGIVLYMLVIRMRAGHQSPLDAPLPIAPVVENKIPGPPSAY